MELKDKLITFGNLSHYDDKIKEYIENHEKDVNTTYTLSKVDDEIILTGSDGKVTKVTDDKGSDGLILVEEATQTTRTLTTPPNIEIDEGYIFCYGDGKLVCLANKAHIYSFATVTYSEDDGSTWHEGVWYDPLVADKTCPDTVIYGDGIFLGGWRDTANYLVRSTDGKTWETIEVSGLGGEHCVTLYFHDHKFYCNAAGGTLFRSDDGITWESFFEPGPGGIHNIAFGEDKILVAEYDSPTLIILDYLGDIVDTHDFVGNILGLYCYENRFYVNTDDSTPLYTSTNGTSWRCIDTIEGSLDDFWYLNGTYLLDRSGECWSFDPVTEQVSKLSNIVPYSPTIIAEDKYALALEDLDIYGTTNGYSWTNPIIEYSYIKQLQQRGKDVTSEVAKLVGGSGGNADLENATLENLTITGALTIEGDLAFGDLDVTTVTAEKVVVTSDPVDDNDVATKKYVDEHSGGGGGTSLPLTTVSSTNTAQANYTHTITGDANAIFGKGGTTVVGSGNLMAGHQGAKNVSGSGNIVVGNGGTDYIRQGSSGESIGNILVGSSLDITGSYNIVDGATHKVTGLYNIISGRNHEITGNYNVITGTGEFNTAKTIVTGKANFVSGDFSNSSITGNYNSIINGGGDNLITGDNPETGADKAQHNMIIGSTTTIRNSENCLTLGRLNTIDNHNRSVLMGIGLTATRDNQLIVGSYNDDSRTGGVFVVGNGTSNVDSHIGSMRYGYELYINNWSTTSNYYAKDRTTNKIVRIFYTSTGWATGSNEVRVYSAGNMTYIMPTNEYESDHDWDVYISGKSNAMTVYKEGTVTIGHDPIGPMDVATKQYVDSHSGGSGGVDEAQVRAIVEDVLLNGNW